MSNSLNVKWRVHLALHGLLALFPGLVSPGTWPSWLPSNLSRLLGQRLHLVGPIEVELWHGIEGRSILPIYGSDQLTMVPFIFITYISYIIHIFLNYFYQRVLRTYVTYSLQLNYLIFSRCTSQYVHFDRIIRTVFDFP